MPWRWPSKPRPRKPAGGEPSATDPKQTRNMVQRLEWKSVLAGAVFGLLVIAVREGPTPSDKRAVAAIVLILLGMLWLYVACLFAAWYRPRYEQEFRENPPQRMGWDVFWMIATGRAPILYAFIAPLGWFLIGWGVLQLCEAALASRGH
jgi:hypothetical protein